MNIRFPLILDGAMGTRLAKAGLPKGECPEKWIVDHPNIAADIQKTYIDAGSQVILCPTFGANSAVLENNGIFNKVSYYNHTLVQISKNISKGKVYVAGDISSTGGMLYPMGEYSFEDLYDIYVEQVEALEQAGVDLFVIETISNVAEARAAVLAVKYISKKPVFVSFTCNENGRTMMGTDICAALQIMQGMGVDAFGINCSVGPRETLKQIKRLHEYSYIPLIAKPNAGLPQMMNGEPIYNVNANEFASYIPDLAMAGVNIFGACCGSDESFIAAIQEALKNIDIVQPSPKYPDLLPCATERNIFLLDPSVACENVLACDDSLEDELSDLEEGELVGIELRSLDDVAIFSDVQYAINNPLCLICDDAVLLEKALRAYQGRALYDGAISNDELLPFINKYGLIV